MVDVGVQTLPAIPKWPIKGAHQNDAAKQEIQSWERDIFSRGGIVLELQLRSGSIKKIQHKRKSIIKETKFAQPNQGLSTEIRLLEQMTAEQPLSVSGANDRSAVTVG